VREPRKAVRYLEGRRVKIMRSKPKRQKDEARRRRRKIKEK
jgi:hypothetical protein